MHNSHSHRPSALLHTHLPFTPPIHTAHSHLPFPPPFCMLHSRLLFTPHIHTVYSHLFVHTAHSLLLSACCIHASHSHLAFTVGLLQRGHEHTRTGNSSESGFGSLRGAPLNISSRLGGGGGAAAAPYARVTIHTSFSHRVLLVHTRWIRRRCRTSHSHPHSHLIFTPCFACSH